MSTIPIVHNSLNGLTPLRIASISSDGIEIPSSEQVRASLGARFVDSSPSDTSVISKPMELEGKTSCSSAQGSSGQPQESGGLVALISSDVKSDSCGNIERMSVEEVEKEIELTWYRHLKLRNEVYEMEMGPDDILDMYISCQTSSYPQSFGLKDVRRLFESNFRYHMELRDKFYRLNSKPPPRNKQIYM